MKFKKFGLVVSLLAVAVFLFASCAMAAAPTNYLMVSGDKKYVTSDEIAQVFNPAKGVVVDGSVIKVYGEVEIPYMNNLPGITPSVQGAMGFARISADNVIVRGMTDGASLYAVDESKLGSHGEQSLIQVAGDNVTFEKLTLMPNFNTSGDVKKTIDVWNKNFTCRDCIFTPNTHFKSGDVTATVSGGALNFACANTQELEKVIVENCKFVKTAIIFDNATKTTDVKITNNTFDGLPNSVALVDMGKYCIGNTSWGTKFYKMGNVYVTNNTFKNITKNIIKQTMEGTFTLIDNILEDKASITSTDRIVFAKYYDTEGVDDHCANGKGVVMVTEAGKKYIVTATLSGDVYTNVVTEITSGGAPVTPVAPVISDKPASVDLVAPLVKSVDLKTATPASKDAALVEVADVLPATITSADLDFNSEGQVVVKDKVAVEAAADAVKNANLPAGTKVTVENISTLPIFKASGLAASGDTAAVAYTVKGSDLKADKAGNVKILKLLGNGKGEFFNFAAVSTDFVDKAFALQTSADVIMSSDYAIEAAEAYKLVLFVKDGGSFDLDGKANGAVVDPAAIVKTTAPTPSGGSSSGCNAGFAALALLALVPVIYRRKK